MCSFVAVEGQHGALAKSDVARALRVRRSVPAPPCTSLVEPVTQSPLSADPSPTPTQSLSSLQNLVLGPLGPEPRCVRLFVPDTGQG